MTTPTPWFHRHPMGGREIYADADTNKPLAVFTNESDCDLAIAAVNELAQKEQQRRATVAAWIASLWI